MDLAALQRAFQSCVLARDVSLVEPGIAARSYGDAELRFGVYAYAYGARLRDALAETFPALARALGLKDFDRVAQGFVRAHPSTFASVRDYGEALAPYVARELPGPRGRVAGELARWEWALAAAFDAPNSTVTLLSELAAVSPEDWPALRFMPSPSMQLLALRGNAVAWWRWARPADAAPRFQESRPRWREGLERDWLVWRQELMVRYRALSRVEAELIAALRAGENFAGLCERLVRRRPAGGAIQAARLLHGWIAEGLVSSWSVGN